MSHSFRRLALMPSLHTLTPKFISPAQDSSPNSRLLYPVYPPLQILSYVLKSIGSGLNSLFLPPPESALPAASPPWLQAAPSFQSDTSELWVRLHPASAQNASGAPHPTQSKSQRVDPDIPEFIRPHPLLLCPPVLPVPPTHSCPTLRSFPNTSRPFLPGGFSLAGPSA